MPLVTYLELRDPADVRPARLAAVVLIYQRVAEPGVNERLYKEIGRDFDWVDRLPWTPQQWYDYASRIETWVAWAGEEQAGYFELDPQPGGDVEIAIFGVVERFRGQGIGGELLTFAIRRAWERRGTRRVWVHTQTEDHPHALAHYLARGLMPYKTETVDS